MTVEVLARDAIAFPPDGTDAQTMRELGLPVILISLAGLVATWAVYYAIAEGPAAIKHDMAEAYAWGQEFQFGYNQHPPFWAWICGLWFLLFPRTGWAFALLSSLNAGIGLAGAWMLIGDFASGRKRMAAWMLLLLTPFYTFYAYKYNANTIFLSVWPWTLHYFMKSVRDRGIGDAIGFGICAGLAMLSKYYAVVLIATCVLAALQHPARRKYLVSASPYVSAAIAAVIFAPHAVWLLANQAPPLRYLVRISGLPWNRVIDYEAATLIVALAMNLGAFLVVGLVTWLSRRDRVAAFSPDPGSPDAGSRDADSPPFGVLGTLALAPLVLTILSALALRTRNTPEMTVGTFALMPLLAIELSGALDIALLYRIASRLAGAVTIGALALSPAIAAARTWLSSAGMNISPFQEVAAEATTLWHARTSLPLAYVGGSDWYENAIAFYSTDRPHVFVHFDYARNLWVTPEALARYGLLSVCIKGDRVCMAETARFETPDTTRTEVTSAHVFWGHVARPVHFVVTIIPPRT